MKKIALSIFTIVTFVAYVYHEQKESNEVAVVVPTNFPTGTPTPPSSPATFAPTKAVSPTRIVGQYKDGQYTGTLVDAYYGSVQVKAIIQGNKITDVQFLDYPHDRSTSVRINKQAMPYLTQEAIQVQNANVAIVSGATQTSIAFRESLQSALTKAKSA